MFLKFKNRFIKFRKETDGKGIVVGWQGGGVVQTGHKLWKSLDENFHTFIAIVHWTWTTIEHKLQEINERKSKEHI